jgi:choice-of-anchor C domain-containing protein
VKDPSSAASRHGRHPSRWANGETDPLDHWRLALKRRSIMGITMALAAMVVLTGSVLAFAGTSNGGFEDNPGAFEDSGFGFETLYPNFNKIGPWEITSGDVQWIKSYWTPAEGDFSLDLSGDVPGTIRQTIATTVNNTYFVSFKLAGNPDGDLQKTLSVVATGNAAQNYTFDATGKSAGAMGWTDKGYVFTAIGASTTITFTNTMEGSPYGPALDAVIVTETVATGAKCKNSGWKTMLDSGGNTFKNQGDCVSFYATKGNNLGAGEPTL